VDGPERKATARFIVQGVVMLCPKVNQSGVVDEYKATFLLRAPHAAPLR
jgi:hypothetical protein